MSAPDRIKLAQMSNRRWIEVDFEAKPSPAAVEYIRKGAFPAEEVERIRELLITAIWLGDATRTAGLHQGRAAQSVEALSRILSLLEDSE